MLVRHTRLPFRQMLTVGLLPGPLKIAYYRSRGARIGPGVSIGMGSVILADEIEVEEGVSIAFGTFLRARKVRIGRFAHIGALTFLTAETITIGEDARINEQVFMGGLASPESHFTLGARTILMQNTVINVARPVTIGDDSGIGGRCSIFTHGSWQNMLDGYPVSFAPVTIGKNVWIPWEVFIMPGVTIGDGATIGARSLVTRDIPPGVLAAGVPAKVLRTADEYPVRPGPERQAELLAGMVAEFCEQLEHGGLSTSRDRGAGFEQLSVTDKRGGVHRAIVGYTCLPAGDPALAGTQVVLSLVAMSDGERRAVEAGRGMWLDLARKERGGHPTDLGEELAEYIKRFGIRFARTRQPA